MISIPPFWIIVKHIVKPWSLEKNIIKQLPALQRKHLSVESRPIPLSWQETLSKSIHQRHISWAERYQWQCCKDHVGVRFPSHPMGWEQFNLYCFSPGHLYRETHDNKKSECQQKSWRTSILPQTWCKLFVILPKLRMTETSVTFGSKSGTTSQKKTHGIWNLWFPTGWFCLSSRCSTKTQVARHFPKLSQRAMN